MQVDVKNSANQNSNPTKKIIFYIGFSNTLQNWIIPLVPFLKKKYNIIIFHIDSLNFFSNQPDVITNEIDAEYDIGRKKAISIVNLIININPVVIVFCTGLKPLMSMTLVQICKKLNIISIYLQHGLHLENATQFGIFKVKPVYRNYLSRILRQLLSLKTYIQFSLLFKDSYILNFKILWGFYFNTYNYLRKYNYAIVYAQKDKDFFINYFRFEKKNIFLSGYPLLSTNITREEKASTQKRKKRIIIIHSNFISTGIVSISYNDEKAYFEKISDLCNRFGYDLHINIHPRDSLEFYINLLSDLKIKVVQHLGLADYCKADLIISQCSTALFYPIYLKLPIAVMFFPDYNYVSKIFDEVSFSINSFNELSSFLSNKKKWSYKISYYANFIDKYIGRNNSYEHQAKTIIEIMNK